MINSCFDRFGVMIDNSRDAVMNVGCVKKYIRILEKLGCDFLMLYTEETYEVDGEPYFGHHRGRFSKAELRELDAYAREHNVELLPLKSGRRAYELLLEETDPDALSFEFDSYWFTDGGADAGSWMKKLGARMKLWHITDRGSRQTGPAMTPILKADSMELGTGNMDLDALREIAVENGVEAVVLESHNNWIDKDPVKSLELSAEWLKARF